MSFTPYATWRVPIVFLFLKHIHHSVIDLAVRLMKQGTQANDAMAFTITYAASKAQLADVEALKSLGIAPIHHMTVEFTLRKVAEVASHALEQRRGDESLIMAPEKLEREFPGL